MENLILNSEVAEIRDMVEMQFPIEKKSSI